MARMIPNRPPPPGGGRKAERMAWEALERTLDDDFHVYWQLRYLEPTEGEADFLIVHRTLGLLALECKGDGVRRDDGGHWVRLKGGREERIDEDPFAQAQNTIHELKRTLQTRLTRVVGRTDFPFRFGHAAIFPRATRLELNLPLDTPAEVCFDASDLARLGDRITGAMKTWRDRRGAVRPLSEPDFNRFLKGVLHREINVVPGLGARLYENELTFIRLTEEQATALEGALDNPRLRVAGGAGTGKTVLALEVARRLAGEGKRVLLVCYNKHLGKFLKRTAREERVDPGRIDACHFHSLAWRAFKELGRPFEPPKDRDEAKTWWEQDAPLVMLEAVELRKLAPYDAVIVDEGQDFKPSWFELLDDLLEDKETGRFVIFHDSSQDVFGRGGEQPFRYRLRYNLRNTQVITDVVQRLGRVEMKPHPRAPMGDPISVHNTSKPGKVIRELDGLVRRLVEREGVRPERIAILTPHTRKHSSLADVETLADVPLADDPLDRVGRLLHTTIRAFKGLESDVLVMVDIDPDDENCSRLDRYVAASRARQVLHVFGKGDWLREGGTRT
jgi:hypothetical protein